MADGTSPTSRALQTVEILRTRRGTTAAVRSQQAAAQHSDAP